MDNGSGRLMPVDKKTAEQLERKCQDNCWLKRGGYDWQEDPYLEEYPYEFCKASDMDELASFFGHGNWAIRQGVVFGGLAFIQQVNGGDEWWTLKKDGDRWVDFESVSCGLMIRHSRDDFDRLIASMRAASVEECARLDYLYPNQLADKLVELSEEFSCYELSKDGNRFEDFRAYAVDALTNDPGSAKKYFAELSGDAPGHAAKSLAIDVRIQMAKKGDSLSDRAATSKSALAELVGKTASTRAKNREI